MFGRSSAAFPKASSGRYCAFSSGTDLCGNSRDFAGFAGISPLHPGATALCLDNDLPRGRLPVPASGLKSVATAGGAAAATWPHPRLTAQDVDMVDPLFSALLRILKAALKRGSMVLPPATFVAASSR